MHSLPCSAFRHCFGKPAEVAPSPDPVGASSSSRVEGPATGPVACQPETQPGGPVPEPAAPHRRTVSCISTRSTSRTRATANGTPSQSNGRGSEREGPRSLEVRASRSLSHASEEDLELGFGVEVEPRYPQIPRPSIIRRYLEPDLQETPSDGSDYGETEDGRLSVLDLHLDRGLSLSQGRSVMAEPDYLQGDCDDLIQPKKLINPVKTSRNHQDLHRELLMNQKRGLAPQNKPELQKVLEQRKRDQIYKAQKEEQEAHKKRSDLEIELMKRQQKLEQLELDQQKDEEEQENTPEFVKMKSNLRRTKQEADGEERTT